MKLNTAFKLSALALAVTTVTAQAVTVDWSTVQTNQPNWQSTVDVNNWWDRDTQSHQFVDLGSNSQTGLNNNTTYENSILNELYVDNSDPAATKYYLKLTPNGSTVSEVYEVAVDVSTTKKVEGRDGNLYDVPYYDIDFSSRKLVTNDPTASLDRVLAGLAEKIEYESNSATEIKVVDSNFLQYGHKTAVEQTEQYGQGHLVDDGRFSYDRPTGLGGYAGEDVLAGTQDLSAKLITVGDISLADQTGTDAKADPAHEPEYGVEIKEIDYVNGLEQSATLTQDGLVVVSQDDVNNTKSTTTITSSSVSTDLLQANKLEVNDIDVSGTLSAKNGVKVSGGLDVTGGLTADTLAVSGLASLNGGANVTGGLTADNLNVTDTLTAALANLTQLNVTKASINQLNADRIDNKELFSDQIHSPFMVLAERGLEQQTNYYHDKDKKIKDGSIILESKFYSQNDEIDRLSGRYSTNDLTADQRSTYGVNANEEILSVRVFNDQNKEETIYFIQQFDSNGNMTYVPYSDTNAISVIESGVLEPKLGGITGNSVGQEQVKTVRNIITDQILKYSEKTQTQVAISIDGTLINRPGTLEESIEEPIGSGNKFITEQGVTNGIINAETKATSDANQYGVLVEKIDKELSAVDNALIWQKGFTTQVLAEGTSTSVDNKVLVESGVLVNNPADKTDDQVGFRVKNAAGDKQTVITADGITTDSLVVAGRDLGAELTSLDGRVTTVEGDVAQLKTDVTNLDTKVTTEVGRLDGRVDAVETSVSNLDAKVDAGFAAVNDRVDAVETSVSNLDAKVDAGFDAVNDRVDAVETSVTNLDNKVTNEVARLDQEIQSSGETTLNAAKAHADAGLTAAADDRAAIRTELAASDTAVRAELTAGLTSVRTYADTQATKALNDAKAHADAGDKATLTAANTYTDEVVRTAVASVNNGLNSLSKRLDDVEETAYRGTAIALAASQQVPNIKPGQFALFGGVGHYESESAVALGGVYAVSDTVSISGALGTAGSEVGARVGASFIFGGK